MENRFGLEDMAECVNCGAEALANGVTLCDACADGPYAEMLEEAEEPEALDFGA